MHKVCFLKGEQMDAMKRREVVREDRSSLTSYLFFWKQLLNKPE